VPYATQLGGLQINYIEMFIKLAFVILLSVEIEACNVRVRKIPANLSKRLLRDPFTKKLFLK
jgi:hypothetical protein